jgi:hypothetical protein
MKIMILSVVLASIAGLMYCSAESQAVVQESEDKELRSLLEARRDTLKQLVLVAEAAINAETIRDPERMRLFSDYMHELQLAELDLAQSKAERIAIIEKMVMSQKKLEMWLEQREESEASILMATAARIKAEIDLHKAKKGI